MGELLVHEGEAAAANARTLAREVEWFGKVLDARLALHFEQPAELREIREIAPPELTGDPSGYAEIVRECGMGFDERVVFTLALLPHIRPQALDTLFIRNRNLDRGFTEFGGRRGAAHGGFLPTVETAVFLLAGEDLESRFRLTALFEGDHLLSRREVLRVEAPGSGEPFFSAALGVTVDALNRVTSGIRHKPDYSVSFPAKLTTTRLEWSDLVLAPEVLEEVENVNAWLRHSGTIMDEWGLGRALKPGYRCLFWGPPGTGKTLTATLIGAAIGAEVYRIDLSMVVSKYIGETEKNLANVFDQAQNKRWILFFDEADALFGTRTQTTSSNDRHANQEISYLLQRVEDFPGLVILATNLRANIDEAFARRFQSVIYFPMPDAELRLRLWEGLVQSGCPLDASVDLQQLAENHELSGGAILNVVRHGAIRALQRGSDAVAMGELLEGIRKELRKEGRTL
jgi:hypothetical protein